MIVRDRRSAGGGRNSDARSSGRLAQARVDIDGRRLITTAIVNFNWTGGGTLRETANSSASITRNRRNSQVKEVITTFNFAVGH